MSDASNKKPGVKYANEDVQWIKETVLQDEPRILYEGEGEESEQEDSKFEPKFIDKSDRGRSQKQARLRSSSRRHKERSGRQKKSGRSGVSATSRSRSHSTKRSARSIRSKRSFAETKETKDGYKSTQEIPSSRRNRSSVDQNSTF